VHTELPVEPPGFTVTVTGGTVTVVLSGELDVTSAAFFSGRLAHVRREAPRRLIFQVARVSFMDCATARLIADTDAWLPPGVKPVIASPVPVVRRVFQASGLDARCYLEPSGPR
jgi:anti-anti-sigma factor